MSKDATLSQLSQNSTESVLEFNVSFDNLLSSFGSTVPAKPTDFLPLKGILKCFEEHDGVRSMLRAVKQAVN